MVEETWLGKLTYASGLSQQQQFWQQIRQGGEGLILGLEHTSVITLGKRAEPAKDLKITAQKLQQLKIDLVEVDRGGEATLHSPGQLVIYPILNLRQIGLGAREYVELLTRATQNFLLHWDIEALASGAEPGLYTSNGKIAFFGIRISQGVSMHGLSINVRNDIGMFQYIRSCGKDRERFDSLELHHITDPMRELFSQWCGHFRRVLENA